MRIRLFFSKLILVLLVAASCKEAERVETPREKKETYKDQEFSSYIATIVSEDGLFLRSEPSKNSTKIHLIAFGEAVIVKGKEPNKVEFIDGIGGEWLIAEYFGTGGYLFSAYAKKFTEISPKISSLTPDNLIGKWTGHRFDSYTETPITELTILKNGKFEFLLFSGGDGGGFGSKTVKGKWKIKSKTLILTETEGPGTIKYALLKNRLILAEVETSGAHNSFLENYDYDYPSGLQR